ncbi:origin recognition complex subunit 6-like [Glandiceps talaboti]
MDAKVLQGLAPKLGIRSSKILRKAQELMRLCEIRLSSSNFAAMNMTGSCKAVMCLELAASSLDQPIHKDIAIKLSGIQKKTYNLTLKTLENALDLQPKLTVRDLAVQFGCVQATSLAQQTLKIYETELQKMQLKDEDDSIDMSNPMYPSAAIYTACRCSKTKIDKSKLVGIAGVKRSTFDKLSAAMEIHTKKLLESKKVLNGKRQHHWLDDLDKSIEETDKVAEESRSPRKKSKDDDFEDWKRKILESATAATS